MTESESHLKVNATAGTSAVSVYMKPQEKQ